jgi:toxin ParE1/3/4
MAFHLVVTDRAKREIGEAYEWYEEQRTGLGLELLAALDQQLEILQDNPKLYEEVRRGVRRALLSRYPYGIFFAVKGSLVSILGVIHTARSPRLWPRLP